MKYMSFIFENQDIRNTVANSEALVELASANIINTNLVLEAYIYENLVDFTAGTETAHEVYERIRDFVISENSIAYTQLSEILADSELSEEEKVACLTEVDVATALGMHAKPALIQQAKNAAQTVGTALTSGLGKVGSTAKELMVGHDSIAAAGIKGTGGLIGKLGQVTAGRAAATGAGVAAATGAAALASSDPNNPSAENMASALDTVKGLATAHPYTAAAIGAGGAGLGAYGIYKAMKAKKPS